MNNETNPNLRTPRPLFSPLRGAVSSSTPLPENVRTIPLHDASEPMASQESPTLPMPGAEGATLPFMPFHPQHPAPGVIPGANAVSASRRELGPVVGWLVIVAGPGRGHSLEIGFGRNSLGRNPDNEVPMVFGDPGISDHGHAYVIYDNIGHKTYVSDGQGRNLTHLNGVPVFGVAELQSGDLLRTGHTMMMFIPFCREGRDWKDFPETIE